MTEFWEAAFSSHPRMWGEEATDNAKHVLKLFQAHQVKKVLIPGFGYGRNAKIFYEEGMEVAGIEISKTAIERGRKYFGKEVIIHHGTVTDMPFDQAKYEAVYCYSLLHLLDHNGRKKLIQDCYAQLTQGGLMVFVFLSVNDKRFGEGIEQSKNTFDSPNGLMLYFYDRESVKEDFGAFNIIALKEIHEPEDHPSETHWMVVCKK